MRSFLQVEGVIENKYVANTLIKSRLMILLTEIIGVISYICAHVEGLDHSHNRFFLSTVSQVDAHPDFQICRVWRRQHDVRHPYLLSVVPLHPARKDRFHSHRRHETAYRGIPPLFFCVVSGGLPVEQVHCISRFHP